MSHWLRKLGLFFILGLLLICLVGIWAHLSNRELVTQKPFEDYLRAQGIVNPRTAGKIGNLEYAPVKLDGKTLFLVAAPAPSQIESKDNTLSPLQLRVKNIEGKLRGIVQRQFNPDTLQVTSAILNGETVILVSDPQKIPQQTVLTITYLDAELYGATIEELAQEGTKYIRQVLLEAWQERQPDYLIRQGIIVLLLLFMMSILSLLLLLCKRVLKIRCLNQKEILFAILRQESSYKEHELPNEQQEKIKLKSQKHSVKKELGFNLLSRRLLMFAQVFIWGGGVAIAFRLFPETRQLGNFLLGKPLELFLIWLIVLLINKMVEFVVGWNLTAWTEDIETKIHLKIASERDVLRFTTLAAFFNGLGAFLVITGGIIFSLHRLSIPIAPLLAGAGILGFAISFGAQSLIKDLISGLIRLFIDTHAVGDWIILGDVSGKVEKINLLFTQIRSANGDLITIPNGMIGMIKNQSKDWSRVNIVVQIAYENDLDKVLDLINNTAQEMFNDLEWRQYILECPEVLGIETLEAAGMDIRIIIKTQAGLQWKVARELRCRLKRQFEREGIRMGTPKHMVSLAES